MATHVQVMRRVGNTDHLDDLGKPGIPHGVNRSPVRRMKLELLAPLSRLVHILVAEQEIRGHRLVVADRVDDRELATQLVRPANELKRIRDVIEKPEIQYDVPLSTRLQLVHVDRSELSILDGIVLT